MSSGSIEKDSLLVLRPASSNGLPTGTKNMIEAATPASPKDYFIEALSGERLAIARAIVHIYISGTTLSAGTYGNKTALTNGILLTYRKSGVLLNVTDGLPIKKQEDWGRIAYDARPVGPYGAAGNQFPFWQVRLTFTRFGNPYGIVLEEGDRLGVRLQDDLSTGEISEHYIHFEGVHIGIPNPTWQSPIT